MYELAEISFFLWHAECISLDAHMAYISWQMYSNVQEKEFWMGEDLIFKVTYKNNANCKLCIFYLKTKIWAKNFYTLTFNCIDNQDLFWLVPCFLLDNIIRSIYKSTIHRDFCVPVVLGDRYAAEPVDGLKLGWTHPEDCHFFQKNLF